MKGTHLQEVFAKFRLCCCFPSLCLDSGAGTNFGRFHYSLPHLFLLNLLKDLSGIVIHMFINRGTCFAGPVGRRGVEMF
jgi:hypothetical protein